MDKYIIVTTLCDKEEIANKIIDILLEKKLVAGSQLSKVYSKYWWNNKLEECDEYKLNFRTKESLFAEYEDEIYQLEKENSFLRKVIDTFQQTVDKFIHWVCNKFSVSSEELEDEYEM